MRLEHHPHLAFGRRGGRSEDGSHLGRVMPVVVHDPNAAWPTLRFEATPWPLECSQRRQSRMQTDPEVVGHGDRRRDIARIVLAHQRRPDRPLAALGMKSKQRPLTRERHVIGNAPVGV